VIHFQPAGGHRDGVWYQGVSYGTAGFSTTRSLELFIHQLKDEDADLLLGDLPHSEVRGLGVREVKAGHGGSGHHGQRLRQADTYTHTHTHTHTWRENTHTEKENTHTHTHGERTQTHTDRTHRQNTHTHTHTHTERTQNKCYQTASAVILSQIHQQILFSKYL